jgi:chromate transporter
MNSILELFIAFLIIGISAFGGGYAVMPLIQHYIVDVHHWITMLELVDITSISQMTPGPIMINAATFVGIKVAGIFGGIVATFGSVLPSFILVVILAMIFERHGKLDFIQNIMKGLRPTIVGLIFLAAFTLVSASLFNDQLPWISNQIDWVAVIAFVGVLVLSIKTKLDTVALVGIGGLIGLILMFFPI